MIGDMTSFYGTRAQWHSLFTCLDTTRFNAARHRVSIESYHGTLLHDMTPLYSMSIPSCHSTLKFQVVRTHTEFLYIPGMRSGEEGAFFNPSHGALWNHSQ